MNVVIANSVGIDYRGRKMIHSPSRWTNSTTDLNFFTYYPWELAYCSALLKRDTDADVKMIDGCREKLDHEHYLQRLLAEKPDFLVMESSTRTINEDLRLALRLKKSIGTKLIFCGQHPTVFPREVMAGSIQPRPAEDTSPFMTTVDHVCLGEYEETVRDIIQGQDNIQGLYPHQRRNLIEIDSLPMPEDEDINRLDYADPAEPSCEYREIQAYTSRGCPFSCAYCVAGNIYYPKPNWRPRSAVSIINEITHLQHKYPAMAGLFFDEEIHNGSKKHVLELTAAIRAAQLDSLHYNAMCAYWNMDREMLEAFKSAGYYLLRVGIETGSDVIAKAMNLGAKHNLAKLMTVLKDAQQIGIKMYGTFTFGGPGSTESEDKKTLDLIHRLMSDGLLHRIQMSINTPQPGTPFYAWADNHGYIVSKQWDEYDGGNNVVIEYPHYPRKLIEQNYGESFKRYDDGMIVYWSKQVEENVSRLLRRHPPPRTVLLLRTSRMWHFDTVLRTIMRMLPAAEVTVLTSRRTVAPLAARPEIRDVVCFDTDFLDDRQLNDEMKRVRDRDYDAAIALYSDFAGTGYNAVNRFLMAARASNKLALNIAGESVPIA